MKWAYVLFIWVTHNIGVVFHNVGVSAYNVYVYWYNRYIDWTNRDATEDDTDDVIPTLVYNQQVDEWNAHVDTYNKER